MKLVDNFIFASHEIHPSFLGVIINDLLTKYHVFTKDGIQNGPHTSEWINYKISTAVLLISLGNLVQYYLHCK
jgi:hypothetical protein